MLTACAASSHMCVCLGLLDLATASDAAAAPRMASTACNANKHSVFRLGPETGGAEDGADRAHR